MFLVTNENMGLCLYITKLNHKVIAVEGSAERGVPNNPPNCSTGLETCCKQVLLLLVPIACIKIKNKYHKSNN